MSGDYYRPKRYDTPLTRYVAVRRYARALYPDDRDLARRYARWVVGCGPCPVELAPKGPVPIKGPGWDIYRELADQ